MKSTTRPKHYIPAQQTKNTRKQPARLVKLTVVPKTIEYKLPDEIIRAMREREERFND